MRKLNILYICFDHPMTLGFGGGVRNNALFLALAKFGRVVTVYGGLKKRLKSIETPSDFLPVELVLGKDEKIDLELVSQLSGVRNFDLLVCRYYRNYWVARHLDIPFRFVDADDLRKTQYLNTKGVVKRYVMHAAEIFRRCIIRSHLLMANQVFYVTSGDKGLFSSNYTYLPNVVPLPEARWLGAPGLRKTILLVGNFNYGPNFHGLAWLIEKVWPRVRSRYDSESLILRVVGNIDEGAKQEYLGVEGVEFAGFVEDISQEYLSCSLAVSPVSIGSGSQIKLLEAMSFGVPILARSYAKGGFSPEICEYFKDIFLDDPEEWCNLIDRVLSDGNFSMKLGDRSREIIARHYSIDSMTKAVGASLERFFDE